MRATLFLLRVWVSFKLWMHDAYVAECGRDGLLDSLAMREWKRQRDDMMDELVAIRLESAQLRAERMARRQDAERDEGAFDAAIGIVVGAGTGLALATVLVAVAAAVAIFGSAA